MTTLQIKTIQKTYPVYIEDHPLKHFKKGSIEKLMIITDNQVGTLYLKPICDFFKSLGLHVYTLTFQKGEQSKTLENVQTIYHALVKHYFTRSDAIVALGGGMIGDLAGFASATYLRGLPFFNIPTSLLAQVDASIGGKTGVNLKEGKNLVGSFYQPEAVFIDPFFLQTVKKERIAEGLAEVVKMAVCFDASFFAELEAIPTIEAFLKNPTPVIEKALKIKQQAVTQDVFDHGIRLKLNFGHTLGHAIEQQDHFFFHHGQAVSLGMVLLTTKTEQRSLTKKGTTKRLNDVLTRFSLPTSYPLKEQWETIFPILTHDKKGRGKQLQLIVIKEIGQSEIYSLSFPQFEQWFLV